MDLVARLIDIQRSLGASDKEFASRMGLNDSTWTLIRLGKRNMGSKTLRGVRQAFPELKELIFEYATREEAVA